MESKSYELKLKFRCVLKESFDPAYHYNRRLEDLQYRGLSLSEAELNAGPVPDRLSARAMIYRALKYTFDPARKGRYIANRFNTEDFAALYTGGDSDTAVAERSHHWDVGQDRAYVVFSVTFTGTARDIRNDVDQGTLTFPAEYGPCQTYAQEAISAGLVAIVAPSKRLHGGSCCALFVHPSVQPAAIVQEGSFGAKTLLH